MYEADYFIRHLYYIRHLYVEQGTLTHKNLILPRITFVDLQRIGEP